MKQFIKLGCIS